VTELSVFEAIHTARAVRRFKPDPVPEQLITQILDAAIHAPSAGNARTGRSSSCATPSSAGSWE
jgi:nitroreductase